MIGPGQGAASFDASGNALYVFFFNQILSKSKWSKTFLTLELLLTDLAKPAFMADILALDSSNSEGAFKISKKKFIDHFSQSF